VILLRKKALPTGSGSVDLYGYRNRSEEANVAGLLMKLTKGILQEAILTKWKKFRPVMNLQNNILSCWFIGDYQKASTLSVNHVLWLEACFH